jgi:transcriptional regulator with XRE-family HTH domain
MTNLPIINMHATGENIKKFMRKNGYTVIALQEALGLATKQAVYKWLNGDTLPSIDNLLALSTLFDVRIEDILAYQMPEKPADEQSAA